MKTYICQQCHTPFQRKHTPGGCMYCSQTCYHATRAKRKSTICAACGKIFEQKPAGDHRYCSNKCARSAQIQQRDPSRYVTKPCSVCGKLHTFQLANVKRANAQYCSNTCRYAGMSIKRRGPNNHLWKCGRDDYRGPNWLEQARKARQRDNYTCQACGRPWESGNGTFTDVHHIIPFRSFNGDYKRANDLSNLIVLCRRCHKLAEHGSIVCPTPALST